jgi:glycosyltransferase involved in cell wall biosynthesis
VDVWRPWDRSDARSRLCLADEERLVVWHGQVQIWRKGLDLLLEAWSVLLQGASPGRLRLLLIGAGEDAGELRRSVDDRRLEGVDILDEWVTSRERVSRLLSAGDLYVFPSRHEGFPVAPVEAMACGLPVVASDVSGITDIFARGDRDGGVVVEREDVSSLAFAMERLLGDDGYRRELALRARARAEAAFSLVSVGQDLRRVLLRETT